MTCDLCKLEFRAVEWCRVLNCPCTAAREPSQERKHALGWSFSGRNADVGAHDLRRIEPR